MEEIKTLQDIKDEVYQEVGYKGGEITGDEVDMIAERYATEAVKATIKKIVEENKYYPNIEEGESVEVVDVEDLINTGNIVLP